MILNFSETKITDFKTKRNAQTQVLYDAFIYPICGCQIFLALKKCLIFKYFINLYQYLLSIAFRRSGIFVEVSLQLNFF